MPIWGGPQVEPCTPAVAGRASPPVPSNRPENQSLAEHLRGLGTSPVCTRATVPEGIGNRDGADARFSAGLSEVNKLRFADSVSGKPVMHLGDPVLF